MSSSESSLLIASLAHCPEDRATSLLASVTVRRPMHCGLGCSSASVDCHKFWKIPILSPSTPSEIPGFLLAKPFVCLSLSISYFHHLPHLMEAWLFLRIQLPESPCATGLGAWVRDCLHSPCPAPGHYFLISKAHSSDSAVISPSNTQSHCALVPLTLGPISTHVLFCS